jgi:hypothetical protein
MTQYFKDGDGIMRCNGCGNTKYNCEVGGTCLDPIGAQLEEINSGALAFGMLGLMLQHHAVEEAREEARQEFQELYPPHITRMPNGQSLSELLSAIDHDPIVPGVFLNGKELRQSEIDRLCPEPPEGALPPNNIVYRNK